MQDFPSALFAVMIGANAFLIVLWGPAAVAHNAYTLNSKANRDEHGHLKVFGAALGQPVLLMFPAAMSTAATVCLRYRLQ